MLYVEIKQFIPTFELHASAFLSPGPLHKIISEHKSCEEENLAPVEN
jgi:hypothetical protein